MVTKKLLSHQHSLPKAKIKNRLNNAPTRGKPHKPTISLSGKLSLLFCTPLDPLLKAMLSVILHPNKKQPTKPLSENISPEVSPPIPSTTETIEKRLISIKPHSPHASNSPEKSLLFCTPLDPLSKPCSLSFFTVMKNNQQNLYQKTSHQKPLYRYSALQEQQPKTPHRYQVSPAHPAPASKLTSTPLSPFAPPFIPLLQAIPQSLPLTSSTHL